VAEVSCHACCSACEPCKAVHCTRLCQQHSNYVTSELIMQVEYFVSSNFGEQMYNSCKVRTACYMAGWE
jgi:hypothetical protein